MTVINTNTHSLIAQQALTVNNRSLSQAMEQLSSGRRINSAADDAAGLAISNKMSMQIRSMGQAVRNANDAVSMIQTVDGAAGEVTNVLQRMRELAVQASNDTYSSDDRLALQSEFSELQAEASRIATNTQWNGMKVTEDDAQAISFQVGAAKQETIGLSLKKVNSVLAKDAVASSVKIDTGTDAKTAIGEIDKSLVLISGYRGELGAKMNRLGHAADNVANVSTHLSASRSRIQDADYAKVTTELARAMIIQQAGTAMLTQANQQPVNVLTLLQ